MIMASQKHVDILDRAQKIEIRRKAVMGQRDDDIGAGLLELIREFGARVLYRIDRNVLAGAGDLHRFRRQQTDEADLVAAPLNHTSWKRYLEIQISPCR